MHYLMLVTLTMSPAADSLAARTRAHRILLEDPGFCGEGGRFATPLCDWFVIGGRWSGFLHQARIGDAYDAALAQEFPQFADGKYFAKESLDANKDRLDQLWRQCGGTGLSPFNRNRYDELGADDDAMPVDRILFDRFLQQHAGQSGTPPESAEGHVVDLDYDAIDESFIGRKWLVVVDYHN